MKATNGVCSQEINFKLAETKYEEIIKQRFENEWDLTGVSPIHKFISKIGVAKPQTS